MRPVITKDQQFLGLASVVKMCMPRSQAECTWSSPPRFSWNPREQQSRWWDLSSFWSWWLVGAVCWLLLFKLLSSLLHLRKDCFSCDVRLGKDFEKSASSLFTYVLIFERERERKRNTNLLFHLFVHSLADSCMCPDGIELQSWVSGGHSQHLSHLAAAEKDVS